VTWIKTNLKPFLYEKQETETGGNHQMKKRAMILIFCIAAMSILCSCNKTQKKDPPDITPLQPGTFESEAAYQETLGALSELLASPGDAENLNDGMYAVWQAIEQLGDAAADTIGYKFNDLNKDGKEELLIGNFEGTGLSDVKNEIYVAFTQNGEGLAPLFEKQKRNIYALTDTGTLYFYGSDGVKYYIVAEYEMIGEEIVCKDFYFTAPIDGDGSNMGYYHNTTGAWDPKVSEKIDMTFEEFETIRKELAARTVSVDASKLAGIGKP
jgi:hypothetical protein